MDFHWVWTKLPNSPDKAWLKNSRNGNRHQPSKDEIHGQNGFKFQNSREMCKAANVDILKKVKMRIYKETPWSSALSNFKFRWPPKMYQQIVVWWEFSKSFVCTQNKFLMNFFQKNRSQLSQNFQLFFFFFWFIVYLTRTESYFVVGKFFMRKYILNEVWCDCTICFWCELLIFFFIVPLLHGF